MPVVPAQALATSPQLRVCTAGAVQLVRACRAAGLKTAVGSSAEQVKVGRSAAQLFSIPTVVLQPE